MVLFSRIGLSTRFFELASFPCTSMVLFYLHVCILTPVRPHIGCWQPHSHVVHHIILVSLPNRCHTLCRRSLFPKSTAFALLPPTHTPLCTFRTIVMLPPGDTTLSFAPFELPRALLGALTRFALDSTRSLTLVPLLHDTNAHLAHLL